MILGCSGNTFMRFLKDTFDEKKCVPIGDFAELVFYHVPPAIAVMKHSSLPRRIFPGTYR